MANGRTRTTVKDRRNAKGFSMRRRFLVSLNIAVLLAFASLLTTTLSISAAGVEPSRHAEQPAHAAPKVAKTAAKKDAKAVPRTPWGDPDLQGIYHNVTMTPLERPAELGTKAVYTAEEAAKLEQARANALPRMWFPLDQGTVFVAGKTSLIVDPPDGRYPSLTPEAEAAVAAHAAYERDHPADSWEDLTIFTRCLTRGMPRSMIPGFYNHNYQIYQAPDYVAIHMELIHDVRMIYLDGRPRSKNIRSWLGESRGHWEGQTLVVETTHFNPKAVYSGTTNPYRQLFAEESDRRTAVNLRLVERFTPVDGGQTIDYQFTVDDPKTWTKTWTAAIPLMKNGAPDYIFEYACPEGNYGIVNILTGHRKEEKEAAEKKR